METIIGRKEEIKTLQEALKDYQSQFVAVYGRMRVGKTFLIKTVYKEEMIFDMTGLYGASLKEQLQNFMNTFEKTTQPELAKRKVKNWFEAFWVLRDFVEASKEGKKVILLDELPWMYTTKGDLLTGIEVFWNGWASGRSDVVFVVCGSSCSWIVRKLLNNTGGLYNRVTKRIYLMPFNLYETEQYLNAQHVYFNKRETIELYMVMGGMPAYLQNIKSGMSVAQIIDAFCFDKDGILYDEFRLLYRSFLENTEKYLDIMKALVSGQHGLSEAEILKAMSLPKTDSIKTFLEELEVCYFIKKSYPIDRKSKVYLYRLTDYCSLFYLKYIQDSQLKETKDSWESLNNLLSWSAWSDYAFENICLQHTFQIKKGLGIHGMYSTTVSWQKKKRGTERGAQVDLLIDRADRIINICEIKFASSILEIDKAYSAELWRKKNLLSASLTKRKLILITFITTYGMVRNMYYLGYIDNDLTMDVLFEQGKSSF